MFLADKVISASHLEVCIDCGVKYSKEYSVKYSLKYSVKCSVQYTVLYKVQRSLECSVMYSIEEARRGVYVKKQGMLVRHFDSLLCNIVRCSIHTVQYIHTIYIVQCSV